MPFTIRPYRRFPVPCSVAYHAEPFLKFPLAYFSGFWLLITLLVLSSGPVYAEWVVVSGNDKTGMIVYVDPDTIRRKGDLVKVWQLIDFKTMQGGRSPGRFLSTKFHKQFDCVEERLRLLSCTDFSGNMGTGEPADAYVDEGNWVPVEPDSVNQALWEAACNKQ